TTAVASTAVHTCPAAAVPSNVVPAKTSTIATRNPNRTWYAPRTSTIVILCAAITTNAVSNGSHPATANPNGTITPTTDRTALPRSGLNDSSSTALPHRDLQSLSRQSILPLYSVLNTQSSALTSLPLPLHPHHPPQHPPHP